MVSTHVALERRGWAKSLMRDAGCFGVAVAHTDESSRGCAAPVGGGFRSEVVVGCLKNRFCIYTRTRTAVCCTLRILSTARAGRPNLVHRHRRHTGALYNAADTRLAALPSCGHLLGVRLSRAAKLQRQSRGCTVRPMSCSHWPPASASAAVTAVTSHNRLTYPFLTAFLLSQVF